MNPIIIYYTNGNKNFESYYNDLGQRHNENGPAFISYYENDKISSIGYYISGLLHNIKGPSRVYYYENGDIKHKYYYLNGDFIDVYCDEDFIKYIKHLNIS